jgi:multiple sugar transport system ATP-binding protein
VPDGEFLAVVGPSGAGKTTLLRLIAGLESPAAGQIRFGGRVVNGLPAAERDVGMVFQTPALFPHLTVGENLALGLVLRGAARERIGREVKITAERLGLEALLERRPAQLSGGQHQRVALGRALIRRPAILLLDEPFAHLDIPLRHELRSELLALHQEWRMTTVCVTHDPRDVATPHCLMAVLHGGRVLQTGPVQELRSRPAASFVASFLGSP